MNPLVIEMAKKIKKIVETYGWETVGGASGAELFIDSKSVRIYAESTSFSDTPHLLTVGVSIKKDEDPNSATSFPEL